MTLAPGRLVGNIVTPNLVIHEGVVFEGQCTMGGDARTATEKDRKVAIFPQGVSDGDAAGTARAAGESAK